MNIDLGTAILAGCLTIAAAFAVLAIIIGIRLFNDVIDRRVNNMIEQANDDAVTLNTTLLELEHRALLASEDK